MATSRNQNNQTVDFSFQENRENRENRKTVNRSEGIVLVVSLLGPWVHLKVQWVQLAHAGAFGVADLVTFLDVVTVVTVRFSFWKKPARCGENAAAAQHMRAACSTYTTYY